MTRTLCLLVALVHLSVLSYAQTILNGDFENNTAAGDMINTSNAVFGSYVNNVYGFGSYNGGGAAGGNLDIINSNNYGGLAQSGAFYIALTLGGSDAVALQLSSPLIAGNTYSLSFYDRKPAGYVTDNIQIGLSAANNTFGTLVHTAPMPVNNVWSLRTVTFTAPLTGSYITVRTGGAFNVSGWVQVDHFVLGALTTGTITGGPFCPCATVNVPYTCTGTINAGNVYTVQLSDAAGSFASPVAVGTLNSTSLTGTIPSVIPCNALPGTGYRLRVLSSNQAFTGTDNGVNLTIGTGMPSVSINANPGDTICSGQQVTFTASPVNAGVPAYQWKKNGINAGTGPVYTDAGLLNNDVIVCLMTAGSACVSGIPVSDTIVMHVQNPDALFTLSDSLQCEAGNSFSFNSTSTLNFGTQGYSWQFGDGNTGTGTPVTHGFPASGTYHVKLIATSNLGCKDSVSHAVTVAPMPDAAFIINNDTQCVSSNNFVFTNTSTVLSGNLGYSWNFGDGTTSTATSPTHSYTNTGTYTVTLFALSAACTDSFKATVQVSQGISATQYLTVCNSALPYTWNGIAVTAPGPNVATYTTISTATGCDSTTILNLTATPALTTTQHLTVCNSALPYTWNGIAVTAPGPNVATYTTISTATGCDSTTILNLTATPALTATQHLTVCNSALPYTWNGIAVTAPGPNVATYTTISTATGCDSTTILNLTATPALTTTQHLTVCNNALPYTWNGIAVTAPGPNAATYTTTSTATGCDSVTILNLDVTEHAMPLVMDTVACGSLIFEGKEYSGSKIIIDTLFNAQGCDSIYREIHITVYPVAHQELTFSGCDAVVFEGKNYYSNASLQDTIKSVGGCDSLIRAIRIEVEHFDLRLSLNPEMPFDNELLQFRTEANVSYNVDRWEPVPWFPDQNAMNQDIMAREGGSVTVFAQSRLGCIDSATVRFAVRPLQHDVFVPSAFSPNGDGVNDLFQPRFYAERGYDITGFSIFNRWGQTVLNTSGIGAAWDGTGLNGGIAEMGTYYYRLDVKFGDGKQVVFKGDVTLIR
jgi:gliding motility-associated-like protein